MAPLSNRKDGASLAVISERTIDKLAAPENIGSIHPIESTYEATLFNMPLSKTIYSERNACNF